MYTEKIKVLVWRMTYGAYYRIRYALTCNCRKNLPVLNSIDTIALILRNRCSVARFGDGELQMISHYLNNGRASTFKVDSFQPFTSNLGAQLLNVLQSSKPNCLVCLPYPFKDSSVYYGYDRVFFEREWLLRKETILKNVKQKTLGDTDFTRFYLHRTDINDYNSYIYNLKQIWDGRDVVIVEGKYSRLGVGNNLFDNATTLKRIVCPATDAYSKIEEIYKSILHQDKESLILLALGHTATVLAFQLSEAGYQAIDVGHVDIEYEWYLLRAKEKVPVKNKYVNEVKDGRINSTEQNEMYNKQIVDVIE